MSNIAGKAYAMNVITPVRWYTTWVNRIFFKIVTRCPRFLKGLTTLSLIHYARWVIIPRRKFPRLDKCQPKEDLNYSYMLFFSNFNGSWDQYIDSFTFSIPGGLDLFWKWNIRYTKSVPLTPFHNYIRQNQIYTSHYYSAYPMASANDVKSAKILKNALVQFCKDTRGSTAEDFLKSYHGLLNRLQHHLGEMRPTPVVSMAVRSVEARLHGSKKV